MIVQAPDNKTIDFGDLPPDQVQSAMQKLYPPTQQTNIFGAATDKAKNMMTMGLGSIAEGLGGGAANVVKGENFGQGYDQARQDYFNRMDADSQQHPITSAVGNVAGFAGSMAQALNGTSELFSNPFFQKGFGKYLVRNPIIGGGFGAAAGFGNAQGDIKDQVNGAGSSAIPGAVMGLIVPPVIGGATALAGKSVGPLWDRFTSNSDDLANQKIAQQFERDQIEPSYATLNDISQMGDNATIADVGGKNTQGYIRSLAGKPGLPQEFISNFLENRQAEQAPRVSQNVRDMGGNASVYDTIDSLIQQQKDKSGPLYEKAYEANQNVSSPAIDNILGTPAGKKALADARVMMQNDQSLLGIPDKDLTEQMNDSGISGSAASGLKLRTLDYVKRALDDQIGPLLQSGEKSKAGILIGLKNKLIDEMDNADITRISGPNSVKPEGGLYKQARSTFSDIEQSKKAVDLGRELINGDTELGARQFATLGDSDKELARVGAQHELQNIISNTPDGTNVVKRIFGNSDKRAKLQSLFPDQQSFNEFSQKLLGESQMFKTKNFVLGGSQTADKMAGSEDAGRIAESILSGNKLGAAKNLFNAFSNKFGSMTPEAEQLAAQKLVNPDMSANSQTMMNIAELMRKNASKQSNKQRFLGQVPAQVGRFAGSL